jgi:hypothetical protein
MSPLFVDLHMMEAIVGYARIPVRTSWTDRTVSEWHGTFVLDMFWTVLSVPVHKTELWKLWCAASRFANVRVLLKTYFSIKMCLVSTGHDKSHSPTPWASEM